MLHHNLTVPQHMLHHNLTAHHYLMHLHHHTEYHLCLQYPLHHTAHLHSVALTAAHIHMDILILMGTLHQIITRTEFHCLHLLMEHHQYTVLLHLTECRIHTYHLVHLEDIVLLLLMEHLLKQLYLFNHHARALIRNRRTRTYRHRNLMALQRMLHHNLMAPQRMLHHNLTCRKHFSLFFKYSFISFSI